MSEAARLFELCDKAIAGRNLLEHPFYQAWSAGTLPVAALRDYAGEYGAFICGIGLGWAAAGYDDIAAVEDVHSRVWDKTFAAGLDTAIGEATVPEVKQLLDVQRELFSSRPGAIGALYAFEAQQPHTVASKLKGLTEHYSQLPESCAQYFVLHLDDYDEPEMLAEAMDALSPAEQQQALEACTRMSAALYDALSGIHAPFATEMECAA